MRRPERLLALGGIVGPCAFVVGWIVAGAATEGYSSVDRAISDLAALGAPNRVVMTISFVGFGLGVVGFGFALRGVLEGSAWLAAVVTGLCTFGVAATPLGGGSGDGLHGLFAGLGYAALVALPLLASVPFAARGRGRWVNACRLAASVSTLFLIASLFGPAHGLWQRLGLTVGDAWIVVVAAAMVAARGPFSTGSVRGLDGVFGTSVLDGLSRR